MNELRKEDRRKRGKDFKLRQFDRRERTYFYLRKVFLTDTNAYTNVYFAQYFDFMGEAREALLKFLLGPHVDAFLKTGVTLLTVQANLRFLSSSYLFDDLRIEIKPTRMSKMKVDLQFIIRNETRACISAEGTMTIATAVNGKPIPIPELLIGTMKNLFENGIAPA